MQPEFLGSDPLSANQSCPNQSFPNQPWSYLYFVKETGCSFISPKDPGSEIAELAPIYAESFNGAPWFEVWTVESTSLTLRKYLNTKGDFVIGYSKSAVPLGFGIGIQINNYDGCQELIDRGLVSTSKVPGTYYVAELCTKGEARGQGICTNVLKGLIVAAKDQGFSEILTRTRVDNENMIRIFKRNGFEELGRYPVETGGVESDRVVLKLNIESMR